MQVVMDAASARLLAHCFAFDELDAKRPSARARLEAELGPELSRRLVRALSPGR